MPTQTFFNLKHDKQQRILNALSYEFTQHPLSESQVARIVKKAAISRGSFYKYFSDLTDAYKYLLQHELSKIHHDFLNPEHQNLTHLIRDMHDFISEAQFFESYDFFKMHFKFNENFLHPFISTEKMKTSQWITFVLSHETIRSIFLDPDRKDLYFQRFKNAILQFGKE